MAEVRQIAPLQSDAPTRNKRIFGIFAFLALILAFGVGLIIGAFAVRHPANFSKENKQNTDGEYEAYLRDENEKISQFFMDAVDPKNIAENLKRLTAEMHRAGTPGSDKVAKFIHDSFVGAGLDKVEFEDYDVLLSYPNETQPDTVTIVDDSMHTITVVSNGRSKSLYEKEENRSPNADIRFNAFSKAADVVSKKLIYVNYGTRDDFDYLTKTLGIDPKGAIVLTRYRKVWRGAKVEVAQEYGAAGVLLFSDPQDETDGNRTQPEFTYPNTIFMPRSAVQLGTVVFRDIGDVLTPLLPSKDYVIRHDIDEIYNASVISSIPVTPISYADAQVLLEQLDGQAAPETWQGGIPVTYKIGPNLKDNTKNVRLTVTTYNERRTIRNVIGYIRGSVEPDRYVIIGNHHDAWNYGGLDPSSGTAVLIEVARAMGYVMKSQGWRPRRTIMFIGWDAEEPGLIGSSEFVEQYFKRLETKTVAYLNVDIGATGNETLSAKCVPLLGNVIYNAARKVPNPNADEVKNGRKTVYDTWLFTRPSKDTPDVPMLLQLDSGSDYRHFLDFVGVPSLDFRYVSLRDRSYPLYHTIHETFHLAELYDSTFAFHQAVARLWGEMARHLADAVFIPFGVADYGKAMQRYIRELEKFLKNSTYPVVPDISHIKAGGDKFAEASSKFQQQLHVVQSSGKYNLSQTRILNDQLMQVERMFILPFGLPGRQYLRHVIFAPSINDLYAGVNFAGIVDILNEIQRSGLRSNGQNLTVVLNDQISWVAHSLYAAADMMTRDL